MINLIDELQKAYTGDAWHGSNIINILSNVDPTKVFTHPIPNAHSIAEIALHLTAWTEEVDNRLQGEAAKEPSRGDWPVPKDHSATEWELMVNDFKKANDRLVATLSEIDLSIKIIDERNPSMGTGVDRAQLINGLIQHHAYHAGQIALLSKF